MAKSTNLPSTKIIVAPNGSLFRAAHIVSVSPLFESPELGAHAFAVYTAGSDEPFLFAAPDKEGQPTKKRNQITADLHQGFIDQWIVSLDGSPYFKN